MAKQNITFIERHLEKLVLGAAGGVLLGLLVLYGIRAPHKVEVGGEEVGPEQLYARIKDGATSAIRNMRAAEPASDLATVEIPNIRKDLHPLATLGLPESIPLAYVPPGPEVPQVGEAAWRGKVRLAGILAPTRPVATTGHAYARIPEPRDVLLIARTSLSPGVGVGLEAAPPLSADHPWITLAALISRKDQRAEFQKAQYDGRRLNLLVADVDVERQKRQPDGQWGPAEIVAPHVQNRIRDLRAEVDVRQANETWVLDSDGANYVNTCRTHLSSAEAQAQVLRPPFQDLLETPYAWKVPKELKGFGQTVDMTEFAEFEQEESELEGTPGGIRKGKEEPGGADQADRQLKKKANDDFEKAEEAVKNRKFLEAAELLQAVKDNTSASDAQIKKAQQLLDKITPDIERAEQAKDIEDRQAADKDRLFGVGKDVEPLWVTDSSVEPGRTYRYRVRLRALNPYAGVAVDLAEPKDAGKVILTGEWSEWSNPIVAEPSKRLFFTNVDPNKQTAMVHVYQWAVGKWQNASKDVAVGEPIRFTKSGVEYGYDAVVVDIAANRPYRQRREKDGTIAYDEKPSDVLTLVSAEGEVEERFKLLDLVEKRELDDVIKKEKEQQETGGDRGVARPPTVRPRRPVEQFGRPVGPRDRPRESEMPGHYMDRDRSGRSGRSGRSERPGGS